MDGNFSFEKVVMDAMEDLGKGVDLDLSTVKSETLRNVLETELNLNNRYRHYADYEGKERLAKKLAERYRKADKVACSDRYSDYYYYGGFDEKAVYAKAMKDLVILDGRGSDIMIEKLLEKFNPYKYTSNFNDCKESTPIEIRALDEIRYLIKRTAIEVMMIHIDGNHNLPDDASLEMKMDYIYEHIDDTCLTLPEVEEALELMEKLKERLKNFKSDYVNLVDYVSPDWFINEAKSYFEAMKTKKVTSYILAKSVIYIYRADEPEPDLSDFFEGISIKEIWDATPI